MNGHNCLISPSFVANSAPAADIYATILHEVGILDGGGVLNSSIPYTKQRLGTRLWRGVTLQLFLVAVLPLTLLLLAVTFGSLDLHHEAMRSLVAERNLWAVQTAASHLDRMILHRADVLKLIASRPPDPAAIQGWFGGLEDSLAEFEGGVAAVAPDGAALEFTGSPVIQRLHVAQEWQEIAARLQSAVPGEVVFLPVMTLPDGIFLPVLLKTAPGGPVLVGLISPERLLAQGLDVVANSETTRVLVVNEDHVTLYQSGGFSLQEDELAHSEIQAAIDGAGGMDHRQTAEGEHVITSSPIPSAGWALLIDESWEDIASPLLRATQNAPVILLPVLALSLLALWFGLRQIVQPIQALESQAGDLARGNFDSIRRPVGGVPEIRQLQATLVEMANQLQEAQNSLHSYIGAITASVESERRSLARELHDETLQALIALGQYTQYALHWNRDPKVAQTLEQVLGLAEQGMQNLRGLVRGLRPIYIEDLGLAAALSMEAEQRDRQDETLKIQFRQEGSERRLPADMEMALYRIAQEALSNVRRHAGARNAWLTLYFQPEALVMEVRDDGQGFSVPQDPGHYARLGHYGLLSMHERAELMDARLSIQSAPGEGTQIRVRVPWEGPGNEQAPAQAGEGE